MDYSCKGSWKVNTTSIPGCENVQVVQVANTIGVRESRHVKCLYEMTTEDVLEKQGAVIKKKK